MNTLLILLVAATVIGLAIHLAALVAAWHAGRELDRRLEEPVNWKDRVPYDKDGSVILPVDWAQRELMDSSGNTLRFNECWDKPEEK